MTSDMAAIPRPSSLESRKLWTRIAQSNGMPRQQHIAASEMIALVTSRSSGDTQAITPLSRSSVHGEIRIYNACNRNRSRAISKRANEYTRKLI
jgi:hypothetical protein